jgi:type II restriction enzyme
MISPYCERAISDAITHGRAILKFISPNDVGLTGGHQYGYLLPKPAWHIYTPHEPQRGENRTTPVRVLWQDGRTTDSTIKWYGGGTRSEFRLTGFGKDFPFRTFDNVGDLLVFIPVSFEDFIAYVLYDEEDIDEIQAALGVEIVRTWAAYESGATQLETEDECIDRHFRQFVQGLTDFPPGLQFSAGAKEALLDCLKRFRALAADDKLMKLMEAEYQLFRLAERQICQSQIVRVFRDVDDFLETASSIMNRRKSRAGRSLENHVEYLLSEAGIPYVMRPPVEGNPDVIIPSIDAYYDSSYPRDRLFVVGVKTTCKDRWRQVVSEAPLQPEKHLLTTQAGISQKQLELMHRAGLKLVVPKKLHAQYPQQHNIEIMDVGGFLSTVRAQLA